MPISIPALILVPTLALGLIGCQGGHHAERRSPTAASAGGMQAAPSAALDADMQAVIDALVALDPKPIEKLAPAEARKQSTPADAAKAVMVAKGTSAPAKPAVTSRDTTYPGGAGQVKARIYTPDGISGPLPLVVYYRGGGWVIADLDVYDATPRALAAQLGALVVSLDYRVGPEHPFPAAHEDAIAGYRWATGKAAEWKADPQRIAIVGESAGGNLALNAAIAARDQGLVQAKHVVAVYPIASNRMDTPSYRDSAEAKPLNAAMMGWFVQHAVPRESDRRDPRIDLVHAKLTGLPPVTVINAESDPLRSDGDLLAEALSAAGNPVEHTVYAGTTHEFFGMGAVVAKAKEAQAKAVARIRDSFTAR